MGGKAPEPPDYRAAAEEQARSSREVTDAQTWANRPTINTPWGRQTWEAAAATDPATGMPYTSWTMNTTLTPEMQAALDDQNAITGGRSSLARSLLGRANEEFGAPVDWSQFGERETGVGRGDYYNDEAGNAIYNRFASRAEPRFQREEADLRTRLYNQGLREGDAAFDREMNNMRTSQNDARLQADFQATIGAGAEGQRMQGMDSAAIGTNTQLRQQQIAEEMQRRGFSLNEINAILTGQQVGMPQMPTFNTAQRADSTRYLDAAQMQGEAELDQFNANQQALQGMMQGAGSMAMAFSDRRLKTAIRHIATKSGIKIYSWLWRWGGAGVGVMADEVPEEFVGEFNGYKFVNYGALNERYGI